MGLPVKQHSEIISLDTRSTISKRYHTITAAVNQAFWNSQNNTQHSLYVGSYGRGTAIDTSDIDILMELPESEYTRYDSVAGNGQSRLLQAVKNAIENSYPRSEIHADGQVIKILFSDEMRFEILPAFKPRDYLYNISNPYTYPDTNMGGNWRSTNPKAEQEAMKEKNKISNGLLYDTCKHFRMVRDNYFSSYHLSGIVIDSFVYIAINDWHWLNDGEQQSLSALTYEQILLQNLNGLESYISKYLKAPGSGQAVRSSDSIECLKKVVKFIAE